MFERALLRLLNRPAGRVRLSETGYRIGSAHTVIGSNPVDVTIPWEPPVHTFVCGRTGSGKTTYLLRVIEEHLRARVPFVAVDFHGQATDLIVAMAASIGSDTPPVL